MIQMTTPELVQLREENKRLRKILVEVRTVLIFEHARHPNYGWGEWMAYVGLDEYEPICLDEI